MTCKNCDKPQHARGLCQAHYRQDLRARHAQQQFIREYNKTATEPLDLNTLREIIKSYQEANK